jgi:AcrR family transcriptional regulator
MEHVTVADMASSPATKASQILAAAAELIEADGVEAATIRAIAARAGASPATIYNLFGSREALLDALSDEILDQLDVGATSASGTAYERAAQVVDGLVDVLERRPRLFGPLVADRRIAVLAWSGPRRHRALQVARLNLDIGVATGEIRDDIDLDVAAAMLVDAFENPQARWAIGELDGAGLRAAARAQMAVVIAGIATPQGRASVEDGLPRPQGAQR